MKENSSPNCVNKGTFLQRLIDRFDPYYQCWKLVTTSQHITNNAGAWTRVSERGIERENHSVTYANTLGHIHAQFMPYHIEFDALISGKMNRHYHYSYSLQ